MKVGANTVQSDSEATRWLGLWLGFQLTLKDHRAIRLKSGKKAMARLRRLAGQMGRSPANCGKVMTACIQSAVMFGSELWRKGDHTRGTVGQANELQQLVNQEVRATEGCYRTTNLGALSMESGPRATTAQMDNELRRFGLRLLSLPKRDKAREIVGALTALRRRLTSALAYAGRKESAVLLKVITFLVIVDVKGRTIVRQQRQAESDLRQLTGTKNCWKRFSPLDVRRCTA